MEKRITSAGGELHYVVEGDGLAVMLIHGLAEDAGIWQDLAGFLSSGYRVITPDLPGSGKSQRGDQKITIESLADACKAVLDAEGLTSAVIVGHSMGGYVSLALAEKYPASVAALALFHSSAYADDADKKASRKKMIGFIESYGTLAFLKQATPNLFSDITRKNQPQMVDELIARYAGFDAASLMAYQEAMIARPERIHILENIVKPVLFIIGRQDKTIPYDVSLRQSHIPSVAHIHVLEESGHMGMLEEPAKSKEILKSFISDLQRET